jgi:hypothetical protein
LSEKMGFSLLFKGEEGQETSGLWSGDSPVRHGQVVALPPPRIREMGQKIVK